MRELLRQLRQMCVGLARGISVSAYHEDVQVFHITCDLSKYPNKVTVHRDSLSHGTPPLVGRHSDISANIMRLSFHKKTDEVLTSWLNILWEKVSYRTTNKVSTLIGTYFPTMRSFFPISSFRIEDSRVGTAESAREDIGGNQASSIILTPESRYDIRKST
jgi:hypothetical protein